MGKMWGFRAPPSWICSSVDIISIESDISGIQERKESCLLDVRNRGGSFARKRRPEDLHHHHAECKNVAK